MGERMDQRGSIEEDVGGRMMEEWEGDRSEKMTGMGLAECKDLQEDEQNGRGGRRLVEK